MTSLPVLFLIGIFAVNLSARGRQNQTAKGKDENADITRGDQVEVEINPSFSNVERTSNETEVAQYSASLSLHYRNNFVKGIDEKANITGGKQVEIDIHPDFSHVEQTSTGSEVAAYAAPVLVHHNDRFVKQKSWATITIGKEVMSDVMQVHNAKPHNSSPLAFTPHETGLFESARASNDPHGVFLPEDAIFTRQNVVMDPTRDTVSLLHHTENGNAQSLACEEIPAEETGIEADTVNQSQSSQPQSLPLIYDRDVEVKNHFKLVCCMITVSSGGVVSVLADLPGKRASQAHKFFFKAYTLCVYASCISCLCVIGLCFFRSRIPQVARLVRFFMVVVLGSIAYALAFLTCITAPMGVAGMAVILVLPFFPVGLVCVIYAKYNSN